MEVTRNGDEEECNRGSGKGGEGGEDEMRREVGKGKEGKGRKGKERKEDECRQSKKCVDEKARVHADRRRRCSTRGRKDEERCVEKRSENLANEDEGNRVRNGEVEKQ